MKPFRRKFKLKLDFVPVVTDSINSIPLKPIDERSAFVSNFIPNFVSNFILITY